MTKLPHLRATSFDVAALAGVSQSAVSRAFTPGSSISKAKREAILEAARKLAYVPNSIASSLTTKRSNIVAVILGNMANPFYVQVLKSIISKLQHKRIQVLTFTVENGEETDEAIMRVLRFQVDGVILTSAQLSTRMTSICNDRGIPIVMFNRFIPGSTTTAVRADNLGGGRILADAFRAAGAQSFVVISGDPNGITSQERVQGFVERLLEQGVSRADIVQIEGKSTYQGAYSAIQDHFSGLAADQRPDAIFGVSDIMAMGAIDVLRERFQIVAPRDIMVAGFDDIPESRWYPYRLTTIRPPLEDMVDQAVEALERAREGQEHDTAALHKVRLIWRNSIPTPKL